jgi:hypothetical protein
MSDTVDRYATSVPGAGYWAMTRTHVPLLLPVPWVAKKSWSAAMIEKVSALVFPTTSGIRTGA